VLSIQTNPITKARCALAAAAALALAALGALAAPTQAEAAVSCTGTEDVDRVCHWSGTDTIAYALDVAPGNTVYVDAGANLTLDAGAEITVSGGTLIVQAGATVTIGADASVRVHSGSTATNAGTVINQEVLELATLTNTGVIINAAGGNLEVYGTVTNESGGTVTNQPGGEIYIGAVAEGDSGDGVVFNKGGTITNNGDVSNYGQIYNRGTVAGDAAFLTPGKTEHDILWPVSVNGAAGCTVTVTTGLADSVKNDPDGSGPYTFWSDQVTVELTDCPAGQTFKSWTLAGATVTSGATAKFTAEKAQWGPLVFTATWQTSPMPSGSGSGALPVSGAKASTLPIGLVGAALILTGLGLVWRRRAVSRA
jgi:hypothetical protein